MLEQMLLRDETLKHLTPQLSRTQSASLVQRGGHSRNSTPRGNSLATIIFEDDIPANITIN